MTPENTARRILEDTAMTDELRARLTRLITAAIRAAVEVDAVENAALRKWLRDLLGVDDQDIDSVVARMLAPDIEPL